MDHGSHSKLRLVAVPFAQKLHCLNRAGSMLNITSQWQGPEILIFSFIRVYHERLGHMLKPLMSKFRPDLSNNDIAEKQVPAKLKPIIAYLFVLNNND